MKLIPSITLLVMALNLGVKADPIPDKLKQNGWFIGAQA